MAITYSDSFTAADATQLANHTSDTGHTYTADTQLAIYSNALLKSDTALTARLGFVDGLTTSSSYSIRAVWLNLSGNSSTDVLFGVQDNQNFYMLRFRTDDLTLFESIAGNITSIGTYAATGVASGNTTPTVELVVDGDNISVNYGANVGVISVVSSAHAKTGQIGFRSQGADSGANAYLLTSVEYESAATAPTLTATLVADANDTALPAATNVNVRVFTTTNALVGTGTIGVGTDGAVSITDSDLTLESGQSITAATEYRVDFQEAAGARQRTVNLTAA